MLLRMSKLFVRTLREDPADAEVPSHRLLVRAGYMRRVAPGIYSWLPLGYQVLRNIEQIIRDEMNLRSAPKRCISRPCFRASRTRRATGGTTTATAVPTLGPQGR